MWDLETWQGDAGGSSDDLAMVATASGGQPYVVVLVRVLFGLTFNVWLTLALGTYKAKKFVLSSYPFLGGRGAAGVWEGKGSIQPPTPPITE